MKEKELENRERMLQCSEQRAHDLEADDIYEYLLQKKEEELNLKCMLLESRERQIKSREGQIKIGIQNTLPIPSKVTLKPQIKCELADEPTYIDTIRNKEINQLKVDTDKQKEETPMLKAELVDTDKRALSEKKQISMPQDIKAPDSSVSQQDKQSFCPNSLCFQVKNLGRKTKHHLKSGSMRSNVLKIRVYTLIMLSHNLYVDPLKAKQRKCCYLWVLHHQCKIF